MPTINARYQDYITQMRKIQDINSALALLHWDNEVNAPTKGATFRGQQIATLSATAHDWATSEELGTLLQSLHENRHLLTEDEAKNIELSLDF